MKVVLNAKIHRAWVTGTNTEYVGSVIIDSALMDRVGMWEYEKVLLCNVTNGARWETYAIAGEPESGTISVQGAGARLCEIGDCLVILSFDVTDRPVKPRMIMVDRDNKLIEYLEGIPTNELVH